MESGREASRGCTTIQNNTWPTNPTATIVEREVVVSQGKFALYKIKVEQAGDTWHIYRRYSDFVLLKDRLQRSKCVAQGFFSSVVLPNKRIVKDNFSVTFLDRRQGKLQKYLAELLGMEGITDATCIRQFFRLDDMQLEPAQPRNNSSGLIENGEARASTPSEFGNEWRSMKREVEDCRREVLEMQCTMQKRFLEMEDYTKSLWKKKAWSTTHPVEVTNNRGYQTFR